jgi:hypothetical protein
MTVFNYRLGHTTVHYNVKERTTINKILMQSEISIPSETQWENIKHNFQTI